MLKTENLTVNGTAYIRIWSDQHMMIERDGILYEEAIDPIDFGRNYTESEQPIVHEDDAGIILMLHRCFLRTFLKFPDI